MKQWTSSKLLFPDVRTQLKMYSFVPSVCPCMHHYYWYDFRKAYIPWLCADYNFGCRALYNLPWRASVSSYQVPCNIPTFDTLLKKCVSLSWMMQSPTIYGCALCCSQIVYTSISPYYLNTMTVFYFVTECLDITVLVEDVCRAQAICTSPGLSQVGLYFLNAIFTSNSRCGVVRSVTS